MDKKTCYICLPISGVTSDLWERLNKAKVEVEEMGFIPVSPLELNNQTEDDPQYNRESVGTYMGRDIQSIIDDCDAVYVCNGWQNSQGCNVEIECAKQYFKEIIYQTIPTTFSLESVLAMKCRINAHKREYVQFLNDKDKLTVLESEWRLIKFLSRQFIENRSIENTMAEYYKLNLTNE